MKMEWCTKESWIARKRRVKERRKKQMGSGIQVNGHRFKCKSKAKGRWDKIKLDEVSKG